MCINPIIEFINQKGKGYKLNTWMKINVLAYADNIVLIGSNRQKIEKPLEYFFNMPRLSEVKCFADVYVYCMHFLFFPPGILVDFL